MSEAVLPSADARLPSAEAHAAALAALRDDLLRFARLQLRDREAAEDLVHEAIEAALRQRAAFAGRSSLKTWVFGILRHRIVDHIRHASRSVVFSALAPADDDDADGDRAWDERLAATFDAAGGWRPEAHPRRWADPFDALERQRFWATFEACLTVLPANTARVFMMREFLGFEVAEICERLTLSSGNCHVILHRARLKLRGCVETGWGRPQEAV